MLLLLLFAGGAAHAQIADFASSPASGCAPLAVQFTDGIRDVIAEHDLPWHVQRLGCRAEYWFCPPPRTGAEAAAAVDEELDAFFHLWTVNRGVLLAPFHNMSLFSPFHGRSDVDAHTSAFRGAVEALLG